MKTNDMKKGNVVRLRNGFRAELVDNKKGNIRCANVKGICEEMGSIYSHNIIAYKDIDGNWKNDIEYTNSQIQCKNFDELM